jgi:hypothetical protein
MNKSTADLVMNTEAVIGEVVVLQTTKLDTAAVVPPDTVVSEDAAVPTFLAA